MARLEEHLSNDDSLTGIRNPSTTQQDTVPAKGQRLLGSG